MRRLMPISNFIAPPGAFRLPRSPPPLTRDLSWVLIEHACGFTQFYCECEFREDPGDTLLQTSVAFTGTLAKRAMSR